MADVLDEIGAYLVAQLAYVLDGTTDDGKALYLQTMPDKPDQVVALYLPPGAAPAYTMGPTVAYENPHVQVLGRSKPFEADVIFDRLRAIYRLLDTAEVTLSGTRYLVIEPVDSPGLIDRDDAERVTMGFNLQVQKVRSA